MTQLRDLIGVDEHGPFIVREYADFDDGAFTAVVSCELCDTIVAVGPALPHPDPLDVNAAEGEHLATVHHGCYHAADCNGGGPDCHCDPWEPTR